MLDIPEMLYELSSMVFFLVPMVALVVLYTRMGLKIRQTGGQQVLQDGAREKTKKVTLKMLGNINSGNDTLAYYDDSCSCGCLFILCLLGSIPHPEVTLCSSVQTQVRCKVAFPKFTKV